MEQNLDPKNLSDGVSIDRFADDHTTETSASLLYRWPQFSSRWYIVFVDFLFSIILLTCRFLPVHGWLSNIPEIVKPVIQLAPVLWQHVTQKCHMILGNNRLAYAWTPVEWGSENDTFWPLRSRHEEAVLCRSRGETGRKKNKARGARFSLFQSSPARFLFSTAAIFIGITSGSLYGRERLEKYKPSADGGTYWFKNKFDICDTGEALYQLS